MFTNMIGAPFDPDFDASNPHIHEIPERFVNTEAERMAEEDAAWQQHLEDSFTDEDPIDLYGPDDYPSDYWGE